MTTEFNELLPFSSGDKSSADKSQIWIIGTREQVLHTINEFYVKRIATDRVKFTPFTKCFRRKIVPAPFAAGKYMTVLER